MYETLLGLARDGLLNKKMLDRAVAKGWITKAQEEEILRIAAEEKETGEGVNHDRANNG
ncbi:XkdX family protein [Oribacterium sinus]|uniref:XkdX family protein n=1 Tax=Oribacterium sinus TaxID=237576 RepID=A0A930GW18_9FIRM|nr:XkdX family protein [Oribacterium sinus]MBF1273060.1 XkdX family protein [Oribacterium sinus]